MELEYLLIFLVFFLGAFNQSLTGFGAGLVTMAFLPAIIGIRLAAPVVALMNLTLEGLLLIRFRHALQMRAVLPMIAASFVMIPLGVWGLKNLDEVLVTRSLGLVMVGFATWALFGIKLPALRHPAWGVLAGGLGGLLGGAYNTGGPPVIIYANCRRWLPDEFKANLTGYFIINSVLVCSNHAIAGNFNQTVGIFYLLAIPALLLGIFLGFRLERKINPELFRRIVLLLLILMGVKFLLNLHL